MKHITFIIGGMTRGGAERVISILANKYAEEGCLVDIILMLDNIIQYRLHQNINIINLTGSSKNRIKNIPNWIFGIRKVLKSSAPDVVISFIARINIIVLLASIGITKKIIISERNDPTKDGRSRCIDIITNLLYPQAKKIVFQTSRAESYFNDNIRKKGVIISNPISVSATAINKPKKKIVTVGRLAPQKNQKMLINAFEDVIGIYPEYSLWIYGEGALRKELEELVKHKKLDNKVFLPGNVDDIHEKIKDADLFVLSSDYEGLSNALLEAMLMGLPCISTNCAGSDEYIVNGYNGILIPIGDKEALKNGILELIEDRKKRNTIAANAQHSVLKCRSEIVLEQWDNIIKEVSRS